MSTASKRGGIVPPPASLTDAFVFSIRGQSNALGRAEASLLPPSDQLPLDNVYIFTSPSSVVPYQAGSFSMNTGQYGVELFLAPLLRDYIGMPVVIDKYAVGGTILANDPAWSKGTWNLSANTLWTAGKINKTKTETYCKTEFLTGKSKFMLWIQGESDSDDESYANAYYQNQVDIFTDWNAFVNDPNHFILDALTYTTPTYASVVRSAKNQCATTIGNVSTFDIDGYSRQDYVHINEAGFRAMAANLFEIIKTKI